MSPKYAACSTSDIVMKALLEDLKNAGIIEIGPGYNCLEVRNLDLEGETHDIPGHEAKIEFRRHWDARVGKWENAYSIHVIGDAEGVFSKTIDRLIKAGWKCFNEDSATEYVQKYY